ncbi:DNASE2 [Branchiostoma lanceolatum]|uniref:deoxyribonuclease II n=1 Tax=Branchiostoma lanceolatum TaxID=7740 RepID=A0A8J9Z397_BRALA|nr:DNASE2 [Branchiostoma lanceolatum]
MWHPSYHVRLCYLCTLVLAFFSYNCNGRISCLDGTGAPVDWFIIYKLPALPDHVDPHVQKGRGHLYMDARVGEWVLPGTEVGSRTGALGHTLQQMYDNVNKMRQEQGAYFAYNDQWPDGQLYKNKGHAKGSILFDKDGGFWLVHSLPRFPNWLEEAYNWPVGDFSTKYAHIFMCVTFEHSAFRMIGKLLMYMEPAIYDASLPASLQEDNPYFSPAMDGVGPAVPPWNKRAPLLSRGGVDILSFTKSGNYTEEMYKAFVGKHLDSDMAVQSWRTAKDSIPNSCWTPKVKNVKKVKLPYEVEFASSKDKSKWAVTTGGKSKWTCIGDMDRQEREMKRGGGTLCLKVPGVWQAFTSAVAETEKCKKTAEKKTEL